MKKEYSLNKVEGFNPYDHIEVAKDRRGQEIIKADGKPLEYISTAAKILWFRKVYPKGILITEQIDTPEQEFGQVVSFRASVLADNDTLLAEWTHQETVWDIAETDNIVSKVQTIALGKALSKAGFGCEIELALGAVSEGETPEPEKDVPVESPKKKRGRPKKEESKEESSDNLASEVESLLAEVEAAVAEELPVAEEVAPEKEDGSAIEKLLEMELEVTDKAPINIKKMAGTKLKDILADHKDFGALVKTRPNIRNAVSEECAKALIYIEDHKM